MTDMAPLRKSINQTTVDLVVPKKAIDSAEPTNRRPILSDVHISDAEDFHPTAVSPLRRQTVEIASLLNGDQLLQMLFSMREQLENQHTEMIRLCEVAAHEKEAATRVHTRLLKQIGVQRGSRLSPTTGRNPRAPLRQRAHRNLLTPLEVRGAYGSETYKDEEESRTLGVPERQSSLGLRI